MDLPKGPKNWMYFTDDRFKVHLALLDESDTAPIADIASDVKFILYTRYCMIIS